MALLGIEPATAWPVGYGLGREVHITNCGVQLLHADRDLRAT
jgi:hypothetical protein